MNTRYVHSLLSLLTAVLLAGCTGGGKNLVRDGVVEIETVPSRQAAITSLRVAQNGPNMMLRGRVQRRPIGWGRIPGHIDVELVGPDGSVLEKTRAGYRQRSIKSRYAEFHGRLDTTPPAGSTIRVIHDLRSHDGL